MSYSRHAVDDRDLSMQHDVNYRVHMHVRRMLGEQKSRGRRRRQAANDKLNDANAEMGNGRASGGVSSKVRV